MRIAMKAPRAVREPTAKFTDYEVSLSMSSIPGDAVPGTTTPPRVAISLRAVPVRTLATGQIERDESSAISWATGDADADGKKDADIAQALAKLSDAVTRLVRRLD